jgi:hypothetical protein
MLTDRLIEDLPIYFSHIHSVFKLHKNDVPSKDDILVVDFDIKNKTLYVKFDKIVDKKDTYTTYKASFDIDYDIGKNLTEITDFKDYIQNFAKHLELDACDIYSDVSVEIDYFPSYEFDSKLAPKYISEYLSVITTSIHAAQNRINSMIKMCELFSKSDSYDTLNKCEQKMLTSSTSKLELEVLCKYTAIKFEGQM